MISSKKLSCIHVYYRHVASEKQSNKSRPVWFSHELSFLNLIETIKNSNSQVKVDITVLFDGDRKSFESDFINKYLCGNSSLLGGLKVKYDLIDGGSGIGAWRKVLKYAKNMNKYSENELIYFLENDYIHADTWVKEVENLFNSKINFDYASLYDHSDKYSFSSSFNSSYKNLKSKIYVTQSCHWRTAPSTCGSFIVRPTALEKDYFILNSPLTDRRLFPALRFFKRRVLLTAIPGLSTHCMSSYMSPCVEWERFLSVSR